MVIGPSAGRSRINRQTGYPGLRPLDRVTGHPEENSRFHRFSTPSRQDSAAARKSATRFGYCGARYRFARHPPRASSSERPSSGGAPSTSWPLSTSFHLPRRTAVCSPHFPESRSSRSPRSADARQDVDAVDFISGGISTAAFAKRREYVHRCEWLTNCPRRRYHRRPVDNGGHANAPLKKAGLVSFQTTPWYHRSKDPTCRPASCVIHVRGHCRK